MSLCAPRSEDRFRTNRGVRNERISILEDPNADSKPTLNILLRLVDAADVGLEVCFVPFSTVLSRSVHTEMRELQVDNFDVELPNIKAQIAFEAALEASAIGVTKASNKLLVFPHHAQREVKPASNSLVASLRETTATPRPNLPAQMCHWARMSFRLCR